MRMKYLTIVICVVCILALTSCSNKESEVATPDENTLSETPNEVVADDIEAEDDSNKIISNLDGLKYYPEELSKRPVAVSIDNHPGARWQAGLSQAEIIYECEVENPYTRYLCIFLAQEPKQVGPVRSARPYLINYALESDSIFVHVGGSQDAFDEIKRLNVADVDGLYNGALYRYSDTGKFAPHNVYTTLKSIRDAAVKYGYRTEFDYKGYSFNSENQNLSKTHNSCSNAQTVKITYNRENTTEYTYSKDSGLYLRKKDGEIHIDENTKEQLTAKNIIVIQMSKKVLDSAGRLFLGTVGSGKGYYVTNGETIDIEWNKKSEKDRTKFYADDKEINLNPGNTWIQIVNDLAKTDII